MASVFPPGWEELGKLLEAFKFVCAHHHHVGGDRPTGWNPRTCLRALNKVTQTGPVHKRTPAFEVFLVAHIGPHSGCGAWFNFSKDPIRPTT